MCLYCTYLRDFLKVKDEIRHEALTCDHGKILDDKSTTRSHVIEFEALARAEPLFNRRVDFRLVSLERNRA